MKTYKINFNPGITLRQELMKRMLYILLMLTSFVAFGQTQNELGSEAAIQNIKADSTLNHVYHQVLVMYARDTLFIENLKAAERSWVQFRNAELKMKFPKMDQKSSVQPMCISLYLTSLTNDRTKTLREWLEGTDEGDVCAGSVKIRNR